MHTPSPKTPRLLKAPRQSKRIPRNSRHPITPTFLLAFAVLAILATGQFGFTTRVSAQDDGTPPSAVSRALGETVDYGNNAIFQPDKFGTDFGLLGVRPDQVVTISVQFPTEFAGQAVSAELLDGGTLTLPDDGLVIDENGIVTFAFQASIFGACRINVHQADEVNFIQFWVVDVDSPESNPPDLPGQY